MEKNLERQYKELFDVALPYDDEVFISKVLRKAEARKPAKRSVFRFGTVMTVVLIAVTLTAGGAIGISSSGLISRFYSGNSQVLDGMYSEIGGGLVKNTFKGITFEVTELYADSESVFFALDIISEKPLFTLHTDSDGAERSDGYLEQSIYKQSEGFTGFSRRDYFISENHQVSLYYYRSQNDQTGWKPEISEGDELTVEITGIKKYVETRPGEIDEIYAAKGEAVIKIAIDKLADDNLIVVYPDTLTEAGNILKKLTVNPFQICFYFDGHETQQLDENYVRLITKDDGETDIGDISVAAAWGAYHPQNVSEYEIDIRYDYNLDVGNLKAVIYKDVMIPLE
jgi:hypothetical protein